MGDKTTMVVLTLIFIGAAASASDDGLGAPTMLAKAIQDYGMAAIVAVLLWYSWRTTERMSAALDRHEQCLIELVRQNAAVAEKQNAESALLRKEISERPCLKDVK